MKTSTHSSAAKVMLVLAVIVLVAFAFVGWYLYLRAAPAPLYPVDNQSTAQVLTGTVTQSPAAPVCRADQSCSAPVTNHTIQALDTAGQVADSTRTNASGQYTLHLKPGHYTLELSPPIGTGRAHNQVDIKDGTNSLDLTLDTGIR